MVDYGVVFTAALKAWMDAPLIRICTEFVMASEMPSSQATETSRQTLQHLTKTIARQVEQGVTHDTLVQQLIEQGWPEVSARRFVLNAARTTNKHRRIGSEARVSKAKTRIVRGLLWLLAGIGVLLISLEVPHITGGIPLLYTGAIVVGFFDFFIGLLNWHGEQE